VSRHAQQGFTLIEVAVAFAIFALSISAIFEVFSGAVRRSAQAADRVQALLTAQSVLERLRITPAPWKSEDSGRLEGGWLWTVQVNPFDAGSAERSPWHAFEVTVRVRKEDGAPRAVVIQSVELARVSP
jgi:type II secretion system protein I